MTSGPRAPSEPYGPDESGPSADGAPAALWQLSPPGVPAAGALAPESISTLARFCPRGFRRRVVVRGPCSLVSLLAFEPGQCERIHQHRDSGEYFHGLVGSGQVLIGETYRPIGPGLTYFRPAGAWHGVNADSRLLLLSIQAPIPSRLHTVWLDPPDRVALRPEDREALAHYRCCCCPCCGGHLRRLRLIAPCGNCGGLRTTARCENCGWRARGLCLPSEQSRAS